MSIIHEAPRTHITSEVLLNQPALRIIRLEIPAGASLPSHMAARDAAILVIHGEGRVLVAGRVVQVSAGAVVSLRPSEAHGVFADTALGVVLVQTTVAVERHEAPMPVGPWPLSGR